MQKYADRALALGAADAVVFDIDDIVFDPRTLLKCMYGCTDWGKNHTCPSRPGNPTMEQYKDMLTRYKKGIIIHTHDKALSQKISFQIEGEAFRDGYYFAFSMSDCALCKTCAATEDAPCRFMYMARPAFHSVGIDVFKTVRKFSLPIHTLTDQDKEEQNWYSAVFID
ncbi:MAG: DUF2284 domain-containing protein [Clostridia bacterium]|nr:DUF2284 domain-containing protein [Clostridia bacterium]MBQ4157496.1 DUF2284 domain-containing protein [Clostridia bacterium]